MREERRPRRERQQVYKEWIPKTELGRKVAAGEITNIDEVMRSGKRILETEIIDKLLPDLQEEVMDVSSTQRMTAYGRKMRMRATIIMGNRHGYIALGMGKAAETRDAIAEAIVDAKKNLIRVDLGCASWECRCGQPHTVKQKVSGKSASTTITIKPAPRGVGIVAGEVTKKVLDLAGVKDCWTFSKGRTRNILNTVTATIKALDALNQLKKGRHYEEETTFGDDEATQPEGAGAQAPAAEGEAKATQDAKPAEKASTENAASAATGAE